MGLGILQHIIAKLQNYSKTQAYNFVNTKRLGEWSEGCQIIGSLMGKTRKWANRKSQWQTKQG